MHYLASYRRLNGLSIKARASFWYTAASVIERGAGFIFTPIFTRLLTPEEYGLYSLYTSFMGIFTVFITLELSGNIIYCGIAKFKEREGEFMRACLGVISLCALIFGAVISAVGRGLSALTGLSLPLLTYLAIQVYLNGIVNLYTARERYYYRYKSAILPSLSISILSPAVAFVITRFFGAGAPGRIYAYLVVSAVVALPLAVSVMGQGILFAPDVLRFIIRSALPLLPHFIAASVTAQAGRAIVGIYRGEGELAVYSVVFSMGLVFSLVSGGISSALSPWISQRLSQSGQAVQYIHNNVQRIIPPLCIGTLALLCFSPEALFILAPAEYQGALDALFPIAFSALLSFVSAQQAAVILYYDGTVPMSAASVASALINLSLNLFLTPIFGYMAAAVIRAGCALLSVLLGSLAIRVRSGVKLSYSGYLAPILLTVPAGVLIFAMRVSLGARVLLAIALALLFSLTSAPLKKFVFHK